jgi:hypothetical protein
MLAVAESAPEDYEASHPTEQGHRSGPLHVILFSGPQDATKATLNKAGEA